MWMGEAWGERSGLQWIGVGRGALGFGGSEKIEWAWLGEAG